MGYIGAGPTRFNTADELTVTGDAEITGAITTDGMTTTGNVTFGDNDKAIFGAGNDLQIFHDGSGSFIADAGTGNLFIDATDFRLRSGAGENMITMAANGAVGLRYDGSAKLATTATGVDVTGVITTDGLTTSGDIAFGDNDKAIFGAGSDLQIYHDGTNSYIDDAGTGVLWIRGDASVRIGKAGTSEVGLRVESDSYTKLYYDNAEKLATTATGVDVTGTVTADGLDLGTTTGAKLTLYPSNYSIGVESNELRIASNAVTSFYSGGHSGTERMRLTADGSVGIGQSSPQSYINSGTRVLHLKKDSVNGSGLVMESDSCITEILSGSNASYFYNYTSDPMVFGTNNTERMRIDSSGRVGIGTSSPSNILHVSGTSGTPVLLERTNGAVCTLAFKGNTTTNNPYLGANGDDLYFNTGNANRLLIDSSGRVTMPYQPSFYAYGAGAYQSQGGSGFAYYSTSFNTGGHYNTSTYRFTAPVAGLYYFSAAAIMQASAADGGVVLVVNGTFRFAKDYTNGSGRSSNVSSVIYLNANDYVFVDYEGNSTWYLTDGYGFFSGCLIG